MTTELRFAAAPSLGRLCRWLRTLGFDCIYLEREDPQALRSAADRIYLTRHADTGRGVIFIDQDGVFDQLRVMDDLISLKGRCAPLSRCIRCNAPLAGADRRLVKDRVPEYVFDSHDRFTMCRSCGRIYWPGTHAGRIRDRISELFATDRLS